MNNIYLDNAASTKPLPQAIEAFTKAANDNYANPSSLHKGGIESEKIISSAKQTVLSCFGGDKNKQVIFTSGATESNNLAVIKSIKARGKTKVVTTAYEHPSISNTVAAVFDECDIVKVSPNGSVIDRVDGETALVSINAVCGETGYITGDIPQLYREIKAKAPDCIVHVDASQAFTKIAVDGDLISVSAHKTGGICGAGALIADKHIRFSPMFYGGGQQGGIRSGTEPVALIAAFAKAVEHICDNADCGNMNKLHSTLTDGLNTLGLKINSPRNSVMNIVNFSLGERFKATSEIMLHFFAEHGIFVSSGSACSKGKKSRILPVFGVSDKDIDTAVRVSFGWHNTAEEVNTFLEVLEKGILKWT